MMTKLRIATTARTLSRFVATKTALPASWHKAAGLLRGKNKALDAHVKKIRSEWSPKPA